MTTYFVSNAGSNTAPYDTEAKAATSLQTINALPWAATDTVKLSSTHTETAGAAITYTFPTTVGLRLLSVTFNGSGTGGLAAGAAVNLGAANSLFTLGAGFVYGYGITFAGGTNNNGACDINMGPTTATAYGHVWDTCTFSIPSVNSGAILAIGGTAGSTPDSDIDLINCTYSAGNSSGKIIGIRGRVRIKGLSLTGTAPTTLFTMNSGIPADVEISGSNLAGLAWTNLVSLSTAWGRLKLIECKLPSGYVATTGSFTNPSAFEVEMVDCDSGDNHYKYVKTNWSGTITADNTKYANASNGTDSFSLLFATSANASFTWPLVSPDISFFNDNLVARTTTVAVAHNAVGGGTGGKLLNSDMWQETLAKVTSGFPLGTWNIADRVADILTTGADQDTDSTTTWTGSSIGTHDALISGSFTPAEVGPITTVVKMALASKSVYVSPNVLQGGKTWMMANGSFMNDRAFPVIGDHAGVIR